MQAILDAAERALAEEGIHAAKMETIAARAGVAVGTVYNYFTDRDALLAALLAARKESVISALDAALAAHHGEEWNEQFERFLHAMFAHVQEHRRFFAVLFQGELSRLGATNDSHPRNTMKAIYERIEKLVRRGIRAGVLRSDDAAIYPVTLLGMWRGMVMFELLQESDTDLTTLTKPLARVFLKGAGTSR
jgi:AcrR family transcriptional regulator